MTDYAALLQLLSSTHGDFLVTGIFVPQAGLSHGLSFEHVAPNSWRFIDSHGDSEVRAKGSIGFVIVDGHAIAASTAGEAIISSRLQTMLAPQLLDWSTIEIVDAHEELRNDHSQWVISARHPARDDLLEWRIDGRTGHVLNVKSGERETLIEDYRMIQGRHEDRFTWTGPHDATKKAGLVRIAERDDGSFMAHWEFYVDGFLAFGQSAPEDATTLPELIAWGRRRATRITVRVGITNPVFYSAGEIDPPEGRLPPWPG